MRSALVALFVLIMTSAVCAERLQTPESFAAVAEAVKASVVSVVLPRTTHDDDEADAVSEDEVLRRLFDALTGLPNRTLGAGVMLDSAGVAVTGARILRGLTDLEVVTVDGHHYRATVVGRDERTDVAVLRISAAGPLPAATLGNSDNVRVGDWVLAMGSPYGFEASVSAGIVSARARIAAGGEYGELLQTDAAVNPGSAGGPLVNTRGEVVALAVTAAPRGAGIAFAVPSNLVRKVVQDILAHGRVVRGWLGIAPQPLSAELARAFRVPFAGGVLLADVTPGGPVAQAGLTRGAIVVAVDGRPLRSLEDLERTLGAIAPGQTVTLAVWRNGGEEQIPVRVGQEPDAAIPRSSTRLLGLAVDGVTPEAGVVVTGVKPDSPAESAGVLRGDILRELNRRLLRTLADFEEAAAGIQPGRSVVLLVQRAGSSFYVVIGLDR
jgi:serine protease Do